MSNKCKCGLKLFECDVVESDNGYSVEFQGKVTKIAMPPTYIIYRCPKCFKTKRVKV